MSDEGKGSTLRYAYPRNLTPDVARFVAVHSGGRGDLESAHPRGVSGFQIPVPLWVAVGTWWRLSRIKGDSLPDPPSPLQIYYTCMNYWMQAALLQDSLHLHELVNGNLAFISDRRVVSVNEFAVSAEKRERSIFS